MKIDSPILTNFIKKACLNGHISTINLNFTDTEVVSNVKDISDICMTITKLSKAAFEEYSPIGEIYIKNTIQFLKYISTFKGVITIDRDAAEPNIIIISDATREGRLILGDKIVCDNIIPLEDMPQLEFDTKCVIKKSSLSRILADMALIGEGSITIKKKPDSLIMETGKKGQSDYFKNEIEMEEVSTGEATVRVGSTIVNLYTVLTDTFILSMKSTNPMAIEETTEFTTFYCLIAPMTRD